MADLGKFADGFAMWRRAIAGVQSADARAAVFRNAADDVANYLAKGLDRAIAADELHDIAQAHGLVEARGEDEIQTIISEAFEHFEYVPPWARDDNGHGQPNGKGGGLAALLATPYVPPPVETIPMRSKIYANHYMRAIVSSTVAPGGFGKTSLAIAEALEMVTLGFRVWYICAEDDRDEIDRRIAAYMQRHPHINIGDRLFIDDKATCPIKLATGMGKGGPIFDEQRLAQFEQTIVASKIDVVIFDPFISFHYLPENDTAAMDALVKRLADICARCKCCIELTHHVRKPSYGQAEITVYDARGAAAIVNAVRSCRVINVMTAIEAEQAEVERDKRSFYLRLDSGKANMAPPQKARWFHLVSVQIANGQDGGPGDFVGTIEPWEFPKVFAKVSTGDIAWVQELLRAGAYRTDSRSPEWLGLELARRFNRPVMEGTEPNLGNIKWINGVLSTWVQNGVLAKEKRKDKSRQMRTYFILPGQAVRENVVPFPGNTTSDSDQDE